MLEIDACSEADVHRIYRQAASLYLPGVQRHAPAGFEWIIMGLAEPAERREPPPPMGRPDQEQVCKLFKNHWSSEARDGWALSRLGMQ